MICKAAVVVAAVMELHMSCQRCYNTYGMYHVQYLQQQLLRSHLCTQLRCGPSHVSVFRFSSRERNQRSESYVFCSSTCAMYSSSSCDGATHDRQRCYVRYVLRTVSTTEQLRESYVYEYVYSTERRRTFDMYSSSCDGAAHELSTLL